MPETKPEQLPKDVESVLALAEKELISMRRLASCAYAVGRLDGILEFAKIGTGATVETEVAA